MRFWGVMGVIAVLFGFLAGFFNDILTQGQPQASQVPAVMFNILDTPYRNVEPTIFEI